MTDQLVSFKTAKLAKKKGFDIIQRYGNEASLYNKKGEHIYYANYGFMYSGLSDGYISAPTQSLLQKWLREKHGLILWVEYSGITDMKWAFIIFGNGTTYEGNSYEECLEAGLIHALNLLK